MTPEPRNAIDDLLDRCGMPAAEGYTPDNLVGECVRWHGIEGEVVVADADVLDDQVLVLLDGHDIPDWLPAWEVTHGT